MLQVRGRTECVSRKAVRYTDSIHENTSSVRTPHQSEHLISQNTSSVKAPHQSEYSIGVMLTTTINNHKNQQRQAQSKQTHHK